MKRKTLLLMLLMALISSGAWAQETLHTQYEYVDVNYGGTSTNYEWDNGDGYGDPSKLIDGNLDLTSNANGKWCVVQIKTDHWLTTSITFKTASPITPVKYVFYPGYDTGHGSNTYPNRNPKSWKVYACISNSDDFNDWTLLSEKSNVAASAISINDTTEFSLNNTSTAYQYFKFEIDDVQDKESSNYIFQLGEFRFKVIPNVETYNLADATVSGIESSYSYTGSAITLNYTVTSLTGTTLTEGTHYTKTLRRNGNIVSEVRNVGDYTITFDGMGDYSGSKTVSFSVVSRLTVYDGTGTNSYIPMYGNWFDNCTKSECIIPSGQLTSMIGSTINSITFYASSVGTHATSWTTQQQVFIKEVDYTTQNKYTGTNDATTVFQGILTMPTTSGDGYTIPFSEGYTYNGGNLLIGVYNLAGGAYNSVTWYGQSGLDSGVSGYGYNSNLSDVGFASQSFLPKTTFAYTPNTPTYDITATANESTWGTVTGDGTYEEGETCTLTATANSGYTFVNWTKNNEIVSTDATYSFTVTEDADFVANFADPCIITTFPWSENFESYSANTSTSYSATYKLDDPCWVNEHISGNGSYLFQVCSYSQGNNSTHKLQLPDMSSGTLTKLVLPKMDIPTSGYMFAMDVYRNNSYSSKTTEGIRVYASTNGEIEGATELAFIPRVYSVQSGSIPAETGNGWYTYQLPIGISGTCYIILRGESQYGTATYMDNFMVGPSCTISANANPTGAGTVTGAGNYLSGASCTLTATANSSDYIFVNWTKNNEVVSTDATFSFTVTESATYEAHFSLCSDGITITDIPWTENFEAFYHVTSATGWNDSKAYMMNDGCWDINHGDIVNPALYTNYKPAAFSGNTSVQFTNAKGSATLIFPEFTNALNTLQLEFKASVFQPQNEGTLEVGYWYNDNFTPIHTDIQTQTPRGSNDNTNASSDYMGPYPLTGDIPSGSRMALHYSVSTTSGGINLDDFRVSINPTKTIASYGTSERGGYYLIASPLADDVNPAMVTGMITDNLGSSATTATGTYDLYSFDQAVTDEWQNYRTSTFNLVNGTGYLYASKNGTTLTFSGAPYSGTTKTVTLSKTEATGLDFPGWNLVGNPFAVDDAYINKSFYTLENSDTYTPNEAGTAIHPMQGLFVVANEDDEDLIFSKTPNREVASLHMNVSKVATRGVSAGSTNVVDQAIISFTEGQELPKLQFRNGSTKVYLPKDGKEYAIVSAESMGTMPVNFKAEDNGTYTLDFTTEEVSFNYLHLIDNMNGNDVDLLQTPHYTFDAKSTDYASRFTLVFATGSSTGSETDTFAFFNNGNWIINNDGDATLQVVDALGRVLSSETISGSCSKAINVATGVYMLRLINGNDVKVQKIVVRR